MTLGHTGPLRKRTTVDVAAGCLCMIHVYDSFTPIQFGELMSSMGPNRLILFHFVFLWDSKTLMTTVEWGERKSETTSSCRTDPSITGQIAGHVSRQHLPTNVNERRHDLYWFCRRNNLFELMLFRQALDRWGVSCLTLDCLHSELGREMKTERKRQSVRSSNVQDHAVS